MSLCSTYIYPTVFYFLAANDTKDENIKKLKRGLLSGLIISMIPGGA